MSGHDDDNGISDRRNSSLRRDADLRRKTEITVMHDEILDLKIEMSTTLTRIETLEVHNYDLERKLLIGKGIFWGIIFTLGTLGIFAYDKLRIGIRGLFG